MWEVKSNGQDPKLAEKPLTVRNGSVCRERATFEDV